MIVRLLRVGFVAALVALSIPCTAAPEDPAIDAVYAELAHARGANDVAGMTAAFAAEALLIDARPEPAISGRELGARLLPMRARLVEDGVRIDTSYRLERRALMGDVAVDAGYMRQVMTRPDGQNQTRYARFLVTLRREDEGWKIIADASMPADEAAWNALDRSASG